jgi:hypothetical protein
MIPPPIPKSVVTPTKINIRNNLLSGTAYYLLSSLVKHTAPDLTRRSAKEHSAFCVVKTTTHKQENTPITIRKFVAEGISCSPPGSIGATMAVGATYCRIMFEVNFCTRKQKDRHPLIQKPKYFHNDTNFS